MTVRGWRWVGLGAVVAPWVLMAAGCAMLPCCRLPLLGGDEAAREWPGEIKGPVRVIDGDTLEVVVLDSRTVETVRLHGIDAPEMRQQVPERGRAGALRGGVARSPGAAGGRPGCGVRGSGPGPLRAVPGGVQDARGCVMIPPDLDLSEAMVEEGMALAYRRYSRDYVDEEDSARMDRRGMWAYEFVAPWDHRSGR